MRKEQNLIPPRERMNEQSQSLIEAWADTITSRAQVQTSSQLIWEIGTSGLPGHVLITICEAVPARGLFRSFRSPGKSRVLGVRLTPQLPPFNEFLVWLYDEKYQHAAT